MQIIDFLPLLLLAPFLVLELFWRARRYATPRGWRLRVLLVSGAVFGLSLAIGRLWAAVLPEWSLFNGAALGTWGGALAGILLYEFMHYWYHRAAPAKAGFYDGASARLGAMLAFRKVA